MKSVVLLAASLLALSALAEPGDKPDHPSIDVTITNGQVGVSEDETTTSEGEGALVWRLSQSEYAFTANGIAINSHGRHSCRVSQDAHSVRCVKNGHIKGERYKYSVSVEDASTHQALPPLDPWIVNG
jgi:hypothetical protein